MTVRIKDNEMKNGKMTYSVPDGYFDDLRERLSGIPARRSFGRWLPVAAFSAACVAAVSILFFSLRPAAPTDLWTDNSAGLTEEEIIEYLINAGSSERYFDDII